MTSLSFPDINVWLALAAPEHVHHLAANDWWQREEGQIAFMRITQLGLLRLVTTAAAMDGKPLSMREAWRVYDGFFKDDRVVWVAEPADVEKEFRKSAGVRGSSPKLWSDAWLAAFSHCAGGVVVTFDHALAARTGNTVLLS